MVTDGWLLDGADAVGGAEAVGGAVTVGALAIGGADLERPLFITQTPIPAAKAKTTTTAATGTTGKAAFFPEAGAGSAPGVAEDSAGGSGIVISCKHRGHATRLPTYAVSQRIR
jgi:hypothetical protein